MMAPAQRTTGANNPVEHSENWHARRRQKKQADRLYEAANRAGFNWTRRDYTARTGSKYIYISQERDGPAFKVRFSDHESGWADFDWNNGERHTIAEVLKAARASLGPKPNPAGITNRRKGTAKRKNPLWGPGSPKLFGTPYKPVDVGSSYAEPRLSKSARVQRSEQGRAARREADERNRQFLKDKRDERAAEARERREQAKDEAREKREAIAKDKRELAEYRRDEARARREEERESRSSRGSSGGPKKAAGGSSYSSMPDEATLEAGFKRGLSLADMLRNPAIGRRDREFAEGLSDFQIQSELDKAQQILSGKSVLSSQVERPGLIRGYVRALKAEVRKRGRRNPAAASAEGFEEFHGYPPSEVVTVSKKVHHHKHLASAGDLVGLQVKPINGGPVRTIEGLGECFLCFNEAKNQLFIEGDGQSMSRAELKKFGIRDEHELQTLGKLTGVGYFTNKKHLGKEGGEAVYSHTFRMVNENGKHVTVTLARSPDLIYRVLDEQFEVVGGSYTIEREGINK